MSYIKEVTQEKNNHDYDILKVTADLEIAHLRKFRLTGNTVEEMLSHSIYVLNV